MYCPKCKSKLYPEDENYIKATGVCSYCVVGFRDDTLQQIYNDYMKAQAQKKAVKNGRHKKPKAKNL